MKHDSAVVFYLCILHYRRARFAKDSHMQTERFLGCIKCISFNELHIHVFARMHTFGYGTLTFATYRVLGTLIVKFVKQSLFCQSVKLNFAQAM